MIKLTDTKLHTTDRSNINLYTFTEVGRIYRTLLPILGKNSHYKQRERATSHYFFKEALWNYQTNEQSKEAWEALEKAGFPEFKKWLSFEVPVPLGINLSSFSTSDDPAKWHQIQEKLNNDRIKKAVEKKLDGV